MNNNTMVPPSALSIPQVSIASTPRPGKRGPAGTSPPQNTSVVNTGIPQASQVGLDAKQTPPTAQGMLPQKSALPVPQSPPQKSEVKMGSMVARPTVQEMIKAAMAGAASRLDVSREASRQAENLGEKTASVAETPVSKTAAYDQAMHLADAVEFIADAFAKEANIEPGAGPGALEVSESPGGPPISLPTGKVTADSGMQSARGTDPANQLKNNIDSPAGGSGTQELSISGGKGKVASLAERAKLAFSVTREGHKLDATHHRGVQGYHEKMRDAKKDYADEAPVRDSLLHPAHDYGHRMAARQENYAAKKHEKGENAYNPFGGMLTKTDKEKEHDAEKKKRKHAFAIVDAMQAQMAKAAEDAINPAKISAGAAVPPDTSAAGESGGAPVGGLPEGNTSLVGSNEAAINYTKGQAKAKSKAEMGAYTNEPALKDDGALAAAFSHAGEAGTKMSSVQGSVKTAAARALLSKLAEAAQQK